ncbi:hypothetical protein Bpfe_026093 [Biomphalaria pfeifferi]|uniref:Uncharacterized protein n=1 Tax=Biomphalaria pfeifferi TaxID=112525 RepID=A0AAD8AY31_BIOPF|nr:hypothetical protein Bpfe_026093 [Biomphalaria pfeifferi]
MLLVTNVENQSTDNATSVTPWWSMDYSPTQSTASGILSTPTNGFSDFVSSHSMAVLISIVTAAAIVVLLCCYLAYTRQPRTNRNEWAVAHGP